MRTITIKCSPHAPREDLASGQPSRYQEIRRGGPHAEREDYTQEMPNMTDIEILRSDFPRGRFRFVVFDFDGTLSLIREGWPQVMIPMMVEVLRQTGTSETDEQLTEVVEDFVMRLNGRQTIYQMIHLTEEVRHRGGQALEPLVYKHRYLAGDDARRGAELNQALKDPNVKAVFTARGGYGLTRLLSTLELGPPRPVVGFSDVTALHCALQARGWRSLHAPVLTQLGRQPPACVERFFGLLESSSPPAPLEGGACLVNGTVEGPLIGGNLSVLTRLLGTPCSIARRAQSSATQTKRSVSRLVSAVRTFCRREAPVPRPCLVCITRPTPASHAAGAA